jgi:2-polyprenyl-3-methyl-5-hydroxy-6-metoxy-1,4-benzoquinol methylase
MKVIVDEYLKPAAGCRVLDIGCGNADLADLLPNGVSYLGLDNNPRYIESAKQRGINVIEASVDELGSLGYDPFDVVVAIGLLHHLDDPTAADLIRDVAKVLSPSGHLVTVDPVNHPNQSYVSRTIMRFDRGKFIRREANYADLIGQAFDSASVVVRYDLNPFPYAHCIITTTPLA